MRQLLTANNHSYGYDGAGNLTTVDSSTRYTYTADNLLASVGGTSTMLWDAAKNRIGFTASDGGAYAFVYDPDAGIPAVIEEWTPGGAVQYVREPGGALIARIAGSDTQYYHFSDLGSTLFLTNSNALITDRYTYDAWGANPTHTGPTEQPYQYIGQMGHYTHYQDSNMDGLIKLGVRYYDPSVRRFVQVDPIRDGLNWYAYVSNNPMLKTDPSGLAEWWEYDGIPGVAYSHAWITFKKITCKGSKHYGFWPNGIRTEHTRPANGYEKKVPHKDAKIKKSDNSECFERKLCDCIKASLLHPPKYSTNPFSFYVCGSWAKDMWNCANRMTGSPKTPPGGD